MGLKKMFKKKDPTEEELVDTMQKVGITTKTANNRQEKFGAFRQYAQERQGVKPGAAPRNPYANMADSRANPYATEDSTSAPSSNGNPYGEQTHADYTSQRQNPYAKPAESSRSSSSTRTSQVRSQSSKGYASESPGASGASRNNPYASHSTRTRADDESTLDLNAIPTGKTFSGPNRSNNQQRDVDTLDLNADPDEEDLNLEVDDFLPEDEQVNSEEEEVEGIKQDIRFVKQESVASTRNTLRMAQEADASGTNTLGMLGSQSERLFNAEQNLLLADTQTKIADDKVAELKRLNRSIFIPASGNPFNRKSRLREQESKLKAQKEQEKYLRETNRQGVYASEQRVKQGISNNSTQSDTYNRYQGEKHLQQAQRYQFENDSEDDEMEKELASNLDQIASYSKKLRSTATVMGQEVGAQNDRLRKIEEDADRLDINVHLNSTRLNNIR
ncbi:hypothetical protein FT663_03155 [Candidozyma haemuli var. vulneris]|uniref:t-SNARE coiled-coil homology domain-containing protein n=1 Tax=Candidozyma haemuli TaxID=45357 RepID=A0A2V1B2K7_9ASCO|nr:hypothetical protein CXQ85_003973 [[Candida] haemuloni]KAF3987050.1 hypothetical protein FT662_04227 [[Candida] haemuloni var. vulneris]KAF3990490.1 hypothetical protein FT663_03155 [[Candida] haemuloni var. vulneris]PVH23681.1 hypothetical protein CXQ85_003973 [[Candida] haemuloni]